MIDNGLAYSEMQNGIYRIHLVFRRDIGGEYPVLKRFGFSDDEDSFIEFTCPAFLPERA